MKLILKTIFAVLCFLLISAGGTLEARSYVRYVTLEDLCTKAVYADSVLTSIELPRGQSRMYNYPQFNAAAYELEQVLKDPSKELLQVWVCGSASPDGLWAYNVKLSMDRTNAAANYLKDVLDIPDAQIHKESLNEDWDRLYSLIEESDIPCRNQVLEIIKNKDWAERKIALQELQGGEVWDILVRDFFPKLRCVRFAIFCKWTPDKPHLSEPKDTVYVTDTVVVIKEKIVCAKPDTIIVEAAPVPVVEEKVVEETVEEVVPQKRRGPKRDINWLAPHVMAVKTNLLADAVAIPTLGVEVQLVKGLSLDLSGSYGFFLDSFNRVNQGAKFYNVSPELRWWFWDHPMQWGSFIGVHANVSEYELAWRDGVAYQSIHGKPAWSAGFTYGASACLDRNAHWGLEFVVGVGYGRSYQNIGSISRGQFVPNENVAPQTHEYFGLTKIALNLVYRFSLAGKKK